MGSGGWRFFGWVVSLDGVSKMFFQLFLGVPRSAFSIVACFRGGQFYGFIRVVLASWFVFHRVFTLRVLLSFSQRYDTP